MRAFFRPTRFIYPRFWDSTKGKKNEQLKIVQLSQNKNKHIFVDMVCFLRTFKIKPRAVTCCMQIDLQLVYLSRPNSGGAYTPGTRLLVIGFIQSHFFILHPLAHWKFLSFHCTTRIFYTVHDYPQWKLVDGVNGISKHRPPSQWILHY